mgnify:CR=1 FL=1
MSDWSSFPNDKKLTDSWRQYLCEGIGGDIDRFVGYKRSRKGDVDKEEEKPTPDPKKPEPPKTTALASRASDCGDVAQGLEKDPVAYILCMMNYTCDIQQLKPEERKKQLMKKKQFMINWTPEAIEDAARDLVQKLKTQPDPCPLITPGRDQLQITGPTKPTVDPTKRPETRVVYYLDPSFVSDEGKGPQMKNLRGSWASVNERKPGMQFEDDLAAFLNFFGPFVPKHVTEKGLTEGEYDAIKKVADSDYLRGRMDKILPAFQKLLRSKPKEAEKVNRMARIFQKKAGRKEFRRLMLKIRKETINLKAHPETPPSGEPPTSAQEPEVVIPQGSTGGTRRTSRNTKSKFAHPTSTSEALSLQDKTLFENWQRVAGINPRVL